MKNKFNQNKQESGQILILGGLLTLVVLVFGYMMLNIGNVTEERIKLQNVADTAAFAAAESQANTVSSMGWINQSMGTVYYYMASHAANVTVESTKMAFAHQAYNGNKSKDFFTKNYTNLYVTLKGDADANINNQNSIFPTADIVTTKGDTLGSIADIEKSYDDAYKAAYTMIPRGEIWLWQMGKIQRGMAYIAPLMAEKEVYLAIKGKAARAAVFPKFKMYVDPANNFDLDIHKVFDVGLKTGWNLAATPGNLILDVVRDDTDFGPYNNPLIEDEDIWNVLLKYKLQAGDPPATLLIESLGKNTDGLSEYRLSGGTFPGVTLPMTVFWGPDGVIILDGSGNKIKITTNPDGSTTIKGGTTDITYRKNGNSFDVKNKSGGWDSMGEVSANVDGVNVKVTTDFTVSLGDLKIIDPNHYVIGNTDIQVHKDDIDISTRIGRATVRAEKGKMIVNGLDTKSADGKWHRIWDGSWTDTLSDQGGDTVKHRMLVIDPVSDWTYQLREIGSYTKEENDIATESDGRFAIRNGANFALSRQGKSKDDVSWLGYPSEQAKELSDDKFSDKWYSLKNIYSGKPLSYKETLKGISGDKEKDIEAFHLAAECWNPECIAAGKKGFYPVEYTSVHKVQPAPPLPPIAEVSFVEVEMCRVCYDNHRINNQSKRQIEFDEIDVVTFEIPFPEPIVTSTGRIIVWSNCDTSVDLFALNNDSNVYWVRTSALLAIEKVGLLIPGTINKIPLHSDNVFENSAYMPKYLKDIGAWTTSLSFATIRGYASSKFELPWDMDHDKNGETDVIMYPSDATEQGRDIASWYYSEDINKLELLKSMQELDFDCPKPMILSEDFFKYGINVAVTSDKYNEIDEKRILGLKNQDKGTTSTSLLTEIGPTKWGMVAIASARCAFWLESNGTGSYIFSPGDIDWSKDNEYAASYATFKNNTGLGLNPTNNFAYDNSINFESPNEYRMRRQFFVKRHRENLYTSDWVAKLVPIKFAVRKDDLDLADGEDFDSSARYIYFNLMRTEWRETYIKTSGWKPPESMTLGPKGPALSTSNTDLEAIFTH